MISIFKRPGWLLDWIRKNALVIWVFAIACNPKLTPMNYSQSIVVDGDDKEWNRDQYQKISGMGLVYSIAQDEKSIKLLVKAMDQQTFKKVGLLGLTIWLDGTGKSKKEVGIRYPLGVMGSGMMEKMIGERGSIQNFDREKLEGKGLEMLEKQPVNEVGLIGVFDDTNEIHQYPIDALKIPIEITRKVISKEELIIEYSIPAGMVKNGKKNILAVGFEIEGIDVQELIKKQMVERGGGRFAGAGGRRMAGGRMGMRGMNDKLNEFQELNQPVMVWCKFQWDR